jgi:hypothetical protein
MSGEQLPFHQAKRCYRQRLWKTGKGADASIVIGGFRIPVHSSILEEESRYFQSQFRWSFQERGRSELHFNIKNINTVWRTLELIYLRTYSNELCPLSYLSSRVPVLLHIPNHTNKYHRQRKWACAAWVSIQHGGALGIIKQPPRDYLSKL